ncbi:MAG TPA: response regulator [Flavisolibacter sp.]|nr:response regulator [Flavisolibacter sp.]
MIPVESKPQTILLIDDDYEELDLFEVAVVESGLPITMLYANECNRDKLKALPKPDFIFLDINMPVYDGFHWLKGIREKVVEEIPIIMYSTTSIPQRIELAYELGANLFLSKPDTVASLIAALHKILQLDWSNPRKVAEESFQKAAFHLT